MTGDDYERLGDDAEALVVFLENQAFMRIVGEPGARRCAALDVVGGSSSCRVYAKRPQVCRDLERGSPACEGELLTKRSRIAPAARVWDD